MTRYAVGKHALGISDRSGAQFLLNTMRKEWTGYLVGPDEFETKQPQLNPTPMVIDPQALRNPRPDRASVLSIYVGVPNVEGPPFRPMNCFGKVGSVTVIAETNP